MQAQNGITPAEITSSIADAMRLGHDTVHALLLKGFTRQQLNAYGEAAIELANSQSVRASVVRVPSRAA